MSSLPTPWGDKFRPNALLTDLSMGVRFTIQKKENINVDSLDRDNVLGNIVLFQEKSAAMSNFRRIL